MRYLFPTYGLLQSESPNDSVRLKFILLQSESMSQVHSESIRTHNAVIPIDSALIIVIPNEIEWFRSSVRVIPHQPEQNFNSVWIRRKTRAHSEWFCAIPLLIRIIPQRKFSFRMSPALGTSLFCIIPCHSTLSPNDSAPIGTKFSFHTNALKNENSFRMMPYHSSFNPNDSMPFHA